MQGGRTEQQIYLRAKNPNPLFLNWLEQWLLEAKRKDSRKRFALAKALDSLKKYPLVLLSGRDCSILEGFGNGICTMIDEQLKAHRIENPHIILPDFKDVELLEQSVIYDVRGILEEKVKEASERSDSIDELVIGVDELRQNSVENAMESLFQKYGQLVEPDRYYSTMEAKKNPIFAKDVTPKPSPFAYECPKICIKRNTYKIILLVDTQETAGKSKRSLDATIQSLNNEHIDYEVRRLSVGDFLWICRDTTRDGHELVLPYIVERKRMDDLASSIKDGRFHEQKFRLSDSGIANIVYLIESRGSNLHLGLPIQNVLQAAINTQIHSKFVIKFTDSHNDSILYLSVMTKLLMKKFQDKDLIVSEKSKTALLNSNYYNDMSALSEVELMNFKEFADATVKMKNFTIRDLFLRQLLQLKTLSIDKALAITNIYPTPRHLIRNYEQSHSKFEAENLLASIQFGKFKKPIGSTISKTIYNLYNL